MVIRNLSNLLIRGISMVIFAICLILINAGLAEASSVLYYGQSYSPFEMRYTYASQVKTVFTSANGTIKAVVLDTSHGKLYFADPIAGIIYQSNLTGSAPSQYLSGVYAEGLAVDADRGFFYFTQSHTDDSNIEHYNVMRANLANPSNSPATLYTTETGAPEAITIAENGDLYFSDPHVSVAKIYKVANGSSTPVEFMTAVHAYGLAVHGEYLYFSEAYDPIFKVRRASLSNPGSGSDYIYTSSTGAPKAMTISGTDLYFADLHSSVAKVFKINLDSGIQSTTLSNVNAGGIAVLLNTPPLVSVNTGISTNENTAAVISNPQLQTTDTESTDPGALVYELLTAPGKGKLTRDGSEIAVHAKFTQIDIDNRLIRYVPNPTENGNDSFTFRVDDGMGETSAASTFNIMINVANNAPTFIKGADQTVLEDAGPQTIAGWATGMSTGPADESGQNYAFSISNNNSNLFAEQPALSHDGSLTYTPAANAYGIATVDVTITDDGGTENGGVNSSTQSFIITVTGINEAPTFTGGANQTVPEDAGARTITGWATGISAGPMETDQTLLFSVTNDKSSLFSAQPAISNDGILTYKTADNLHGQATVTVKLQDNGGTANGGADTSSSQTFTITVDPVNDPPTFTKGPDQTVLEDAGAQMIDGWAAAISKGPADEISQTYWFDTTNDNVSLFAVQPQVENTGRLIFTPAADAYGSATVTVTMKDNGGTANGGNDSFTQIFTITVTAINEAPSFTGGTHQTIPEDAGAQTISGWASGISAGPKETDQTLNFIVTNDKNSLFSAQPAVSANGTLTYTVSADKFDTAKVTVILQDNGGTANGGVDISSSQDFNIIINAVNDAPVFTKGANQTVAEGAGAQTISNWANGMSVGPANESSQTYRFSCSNDNNSLFSVQPEVAHDGTLTYTPADAAYGSAAVTVTIIDDGGTLNGGINTSSQDFDITISPINNPPEMNVPGAQSIREDNTISFTGANTIIIADSDAGLSPIEFGITVDNGTFSLNGSTGLTFIEGDGSADQTMLFTGTLASINQALNGMTYIPSLNFNGTAVLTFNVNDQGNTGVGGALTDTDKVDITIISVNDAPTLDTIANLSLPKNPGQQTVNLTGISPGGGEVQNLTITASSNNTGMIPNIAVSYTSPDPTGSLVFTPNKSGTAVITVLLKDDGNNSDGGVSNQTRSFTVAVAGSNSGGGGSSAITPEKPILNNIPVVDLKNDGDSTANLSPAYVKNLASGNQALTVKNHGITVEFPPQSLMGTELENALKQTDSVLEIKAGEISAADKAKLLELAPLGQSTGIFDIGGIIFDLSAQFTTVTNGTTNTVKITSFPEPVAVTIDLSQLGERSPEQIAALTGVRFVKDASGKITPVKLGGTYNPVTKTFTFYTDRFSLYGVLRAEKIVNINLELEKTAATVNGKSKTLDVGPMLVNDRTMVPFRFIGEAFGAKVDWLANTRTVVIILDNQEMRLTVDEKVPGMDVSPVIVQGRTLVPIRYISESLGAYVKWFPSSRKIEIVK